MTTLDDRRYRILQLSDTHVGQHGVDEDGVDALGALQGLLVDLAHIPHVDLVLVTGDVADDGSAAGCAMVRDVVGRFARQRGVPHVYTTGNHDRRPGFIAALGSGHLSAVGDDGAERALGGEERAAVSTVGGLRIVTLDSLVPGQTHGVVSERQLMWLGEVLRTPAADGTFIPLHHPPVHLPHSPMKRVVLQNIQELADVLRGSDVRAVLTGHLHLQLVASLVGVPVWVTPGVVTRIDLTSPPGLVRGVLGAGPPSSTSADRSRRCSRRCRPVMPVPASWCTCVTPKPALTSTRPTRQCTPAPVSQCLAGLDRPRNRLWTRAQYPANPRIDGGSSVGSR